MNARVAMTSMVLLWRMRLGRWLSSFFSREKWGEHIGFIIVLMSSIAGFSTYVLVNDNLVSRNKIGGVYWLLAIDFALLLALSYVVGRRAWDVWSRRKQQTIGAQLHIQLMTVFSVLATVPAFILATFSLAFINVGIQSWFGDSIRMAVTESQQVAQAYLQEHQQSISTDVLAMANDLNREAVRLQSDENFLDEYFRTQVFLRNLSEAILIDTTGRVIEEAGISFSIQMLPRGFGGLIRQANDGKPVLLVGENDDRVRALVRLDNFMDTYLFVGRFVDEKVLSSVRSTDLAAHDYRTLEASQDKLKISMTLVFSLVGLILLLVAIWTGLSLAERIVTPVIRLMQASERIRSGDLNARVEVDNNESELTMLARSFNRMTDQLRTQRRDLINANSQLDERRRFTETVLAGVNAGILGMDAEGVIQVANASAEKLLDKSADKLIGKKLSDISPDIEKVRRLVRSKPGRSVETPVDVYIDPLEPSHWIVRMTAEGEGDDLRGFVATFDDLSPMMEAQRKAAWADVARRVAHEIKNPLTPIQLSAERLKRRYSKNLVEEDREIFEMCTETIVRHVDDIRHMVDEFSAFARMPNAKKKTENMVVLCQQVVVLFQQGHRDVTFRFERPDQPISLTADRQQITQALTNLIKNAYEAMPTDGDDTNAKRGTIDVSLTQDDKNVIVRVSDDGMGWPKDVAFKLTDPYVTTKTNGTGLGLSIVSKIVEDHKGTLTLSDNHPRGASVTMIFPKGETHNG